MDVVFTETYWYDVNTGYLIESEWEAFATANHPESYGNFQWKEKISLTDSSFELPMSNYGFRLYVIILSIIIILILIGWTLYRSAIRRDVNQVLNYLKNEITETQFVHGKSWLNRALNAFQPPFYSFDKALKNVDVLWNPLELPYHSLLVEKTAEEKLGLKDGLFMVIDPFNRVGVIDLLRQKMVSPLLFNIDSQNIYLLLKLALSAQSAENSETIENLLEKAVSVDMEKISTKNRTAGEILMLCSSTREIKRYAKAFGWKQDYFGFHTHLNSLDKWKIVQPRNSSTSSEKPKTPLKLREMAEIRPYFASPDRLLEKEIRLFPKDLKELQKLKQKYNLWPQRDVSTEFNQVAHLLARRKLFDYTLGQAPLTPSSYLKKFYHVMKFHPSKVLLIGDDDLLSISLARNGVDVTLLEIDPYTCALVQGIADNEHLPVSIHQIDLTKPLPSKIPDTFDLFVADPDFTPLSFTLFFSRGFSKLNTNGRGIINFEGKRFQRNVVNLLLKKLHYEIEEFHKGQWTYSSIHHEKRKIVDSVSHYRSGKYSHLDYSYHFEHEIVYTEAPFHSQLYIVRKTANSILPIAAEASIDISKRNFYDY